jgi:hypothetical protein
LPKKFDPPRIESVAAGSPASAAGLRRGDALTSVNGRPVRDLLDFRFHSVDGPLACGFERAGRPFRITIPDGDAEAFGLKFEPMRFRPCGNKCVFCFVDQNPPGVRAGLAFKDEDYRLSFLFGNYVTLTAVGEEDLERIAEQRLSPLYVSVHAADPEVRRRLLGIRKDDRLTEKIRYLGERGVEMHGQVVLCPGINDGAVLEETVAALAGYFPAFRSVAVVPVGLTRHRRGLADLNPVTASAATALLDRIGPMQRRFRSETGESFVYAADEFYLLAEGQRRRHGAFPPFGFLAEPASPASVFRPAHPVHGRHGNPRGARNQKPYTSRPELDPERILLPHGCSEPVFRGFRDRFRAADRPRYRGRAPVLPAFRYGPSAVQLPEQRRAHARRLDPGETVGPAAASGPGSGILHGH